MIFEIFYIIILSILPISELRIGLPYAIIFAIKNNIPLWLIFLLVILSNVLIIFFIFFFLDRLNKILLKNIYYKKFFYFYIKKMQKKIDKFEKKYSSIGFLALIIFVAIPFPGTGAWTGGLISWLLELDRKKSIFSIIIGVISAGILVLLMTLGFLSVF